MRSGWAGCSGSIKGVTEEPRKEAMAEPAPEAAPRYGVDAAEAFTLAASDAVPPAGLPHNSMSFARTVAALHGFARKAVNPIDKHWSMSWLIVLAVTATTGNDV